MILATKADVRRPGFRHIDVFNLPAGFVEDRHAMTAEVKITPFVNRHAVRTLRAEQRFVRERTVGPDVVGISAVRANVGNEKFFAVRRAGDAIGLFEIVCDRASFLPSGER